MELRSLSATFGRLKQETLTLSPGFNIIEAANESGKSTWMAFLRVMLYGLSTRDRGPLADKNRYMPWDGSAMQGQMDLTVDGESVTVTRATLRPNAPMGGFSACYTGTADPVPGLTAAQLGETLLGVPQEVFERSAFIRQSGISIDHSPALEQRIASLVSTGEEDASYTDAADRLRRQLNRRRYHKTGLLPQLESEIFTLEATLSEISAAEASIRDLDAQLTDLEQQRSYLSHQIDLCEREENTLRLARLENTRSAFTAARELRDTAAARVARLPAKEELERILGELNSARSLEQSVQTARARMQTHANALKRSDDALAAHPFAPHTPDEIAASPVTRIPHPRFPVLGGVLTLVGSAAVLSLLYFILKLSLPVSAGIALIAAGAVLIALGLDTVRRQNRWEAEAEGRRIARQAELSEYTLLYETAEADRAAFCAADQAYRTLAADHHARLERIFAFVSRFSGAATAAEAHRAVDNALALHAAFGEADRQYQTVKLRLEVLSENAPSIPTAPAETPVLTRAEAEEQLNGLELRLADLRRTIHTARGRMDAMGDGALLQAELEEKNRKRAALQAEFDALALAAQVLSEANATMQTRFSPALGEKAANVFTKLTRGKYNKVLLDRTLAPSAREDGGISAHTVSALSQGAADQLYLSVRLGICQTILPEERRVPICLDDALVTFDDERMAAALDYLVELSRERQILLFTCQQRELNYLRAAHPGRYHAVELS